MVDGYLVDSGVFVRWFIKQAGWQHARTVRDAYLAGGVVLQTVDVVRFEVANVLRKVGLLPGLLDQEQYVQAARAVDDLGVVVQVTDARALERAAALSARCMVNFYDALVVDQALEQGLPLLTSDAKLCRAIGDLLSTELLRGVATP
ncbi:MAG: type II toxin-antitoxin system VapC family toxin [Euzebyales bacterium]|nr:type II toxin-antitoxin system VapC family toxin [Euzebyales bacterium]